jgi:hypothetical protein
MDTKGIAAFVTVGIFVWGAWAFAEWVGSFHAGVAFLALLCAIER